MLLSTRGHYYLSSSNEETGFPGGSVAQDPPVNAGDPGLIPASEDPLEKDMATHSSIPA